MTPQKLVAAQRKDVVLVYRDQLLPYSETFILAQGESCTTHSCAYVGLTALGKTAAVGQAWQAALRERFIVLSSLAWPAQLWRLAYRVWGWVLSAWMRSLQAHSPRLIHAHFGPDGGFAASLAKSLKIPLIVTFHGYDATCHSVDTAGPSLWLFLSQRDLFFKRLAQQRGRVPFTAASRIVAVSQFIRVSLIAKGCPPEKIEVHYTGVDLRLFHRDRRVPRERIVLFVGRLVEKKGCGVLIDAMAQVNSRLAVSKMQRDSPSKRLRHLAPVRLVIIGEGGLRSQLTAQAKAAGLTPEFLGIQSPAQVRDWMNRAWLLCAPSVTAHSGDAEGLGMVSLEAQAMELPVVATRSGGIPEAVIDGQTGLLVPEYDAIALAAAIARVLQDEGLRDRLAKAGRAHVERKFDLHQNTAQLERLYATVIQQHQRNSTAQRSVASINESINASIKSEGAA